MTTLSTTDVWTGDYLVERGLISLSQLDEATDLAESWDSSLSDVLMARNFVRPIQYYRALAERFGISFVDLRAEPPDPAVLDASEVEDYARELTLPWQRRNGRLVIATANPGPEAILYAHRRWGRDIDLVLTAKFDVLWSLQRAFGDYHSNRAVYELAELDPEMSARTVFTRQQILALWGIITVFAIGLCIAPFATLIALNTLMSVFYLGNFVFKIILVWFGARPAQGNAEARGGHCDAHRRRRATGAAPRLRGQRRTDRVASSS